MTWKITNRRLTYIQLSITHQTIQLIYIYFICLILFMFICVFIVGPFGIVAVDVLCDSWMSKHHWLNTNPLIILCFGYFLPSRSTSTPLAICLFYVFHFWSFVNLQANNTHVVCLVLPNFLFGGLFATVRRQWCVYQHFFLPMCSCDVQIVFCCYR